MAGSQNEITQKSALKKRGYTILSKIGQGSYAKVYLGEFVSVLPGQTTGPTTKLAVKVVDTRYVTRDFVKKFLPRELNILSRISHPHIIHIHSILQIGSTFYIFMRFAEQGDLLEFIIRNGTVNENQARVWARQIALALQYLHELNIAHRDMKCENILVTLNYNVKLTDFGFARYTVDTKRKPVLSETYCGSLSYASPEILLGHPYNAKISDVWSFGVIIYVMLSKSMPFNDTIPKLMYESQIKRNIKFRPKVASTLSNEIKNLMPKLLEPDPLKRSRIEGVINSDWVAMDKRLIAFHPAEHAALTNAFDNQLTPPETFSLNLKIANRTTPAVEKTEKQPSVSGVFIKPYNKETSKLSENYKTPSDIRQTQDVLKKS